MVTSAQCNRRSVIGGPILVGHRGAVATWSRVGILDVYRQGYPDDGIETTPLEPDPVETGGGSAACLISRRLIPSRAKFSSTATRMCVSRCAKSHSSRARRP